MAKENLSGQIPEDLVKPKKISSELKFISASGMGLAGGIVVGGGIEASNTRAVIIGGVMYAVGATINRALAERADNAVNALRNVRDKLKQEDR